MYELPPHHYYSGMPQGTRAISMHIPNHEQVDSGFGFQCDAGVLQVVQTLNHHGYKTLWSCQGLPGKPYVMLKLGTKYKHVDNLVSVLYSYMDRVIGVEYHPSIRYKHIDQPNGVVLRWNKLDYDKVCQRIVRCVTELS